MKYTSDDGEKTEDIPPLQQDLENKITQIAHEKCTNQVPEEVNLQLQTEFKYELERIYIKEEPGSDSDVRKDSPGYVTLKTETLDVGTYEITHRKIKFEDEEKVDCKIVTQVDGSLNIKLEEYIDELKTNIPKDLEDKEGSKSEINTNGTQILDTTSNDKKPSQNREETLIYCDQCTFKTRYKRNLKLHKQRHDSEREIFSCKYCNDKFVRKLSLEGHLLSKHRQQINVSEISSKLHECTRCTYVTVRKTRLTQHMNKHKVTPLTITTNLEKWKCEHCKFSTYRKRYLTKHLLIHSNSYACTICGKSFGSKTTFDSHLVSFHSDNKDLMSTLTKKIYECQQCSYKCLGSAKLKLHMLRHPSTELQKFYCEHCPFATYRKVSLKKHVVIHRKNKPHVCSVCDKSYNQKSLLDSHIVNNHFHNKRVMATVTHSVYICPEPKCPYKSIATSKMRSHMLGHKSLQKPGINGTHV